MSLTNTAETDLLALLLQNTIPSWATGTGIILTNFFVGLTTLDPGESGSFTNELTYTPYARVSVTRNSTNFPVSGNTGNNGALITFPKRTDNGAAQVAAFWFIATASTAGTMLLKGPLAGARLAFTALASSDTFTVPGLTGVANGDQVVLHPTQGAVLPTGGGLTEGVLYFVIGLSGNTFQLSTTSGGSAINFTADGSGFMTRCSTLSVTQNVQPEFPINGISIFAD